MRESSASPATSAISGDPHRPASVTRSRWWPRIGVRQLGVRGRQRDPPGREQSRRDPVVRRLPCAARCCARGSVVMGTSQGCRPPPGRNRARVVYAAATSASQRGRPALPTTATTCGTSASPRSRRRGVDGAGSPAEDQDGAQGGVLAAPAWTAFSRRSTSASRPARCRARSPSCRETSMGPPAFSRPVLPARGRVPGVLPPRTDRFVNATFTVRSC